MLNLGLFHYVNEDGGKLNDFNCVLGVRAGLQCWNPILEQMHSDVSGFSVYFFFCDVLFISFLVLFHCNHSLGGKTRK